MKYTAIEFTNEKIYIKEFLKLPKKLYKASELIQNITQEKQILQGTHFLSHYFKCYNLLVIDEKKQAVARAILTIYDGDNCSYLGFFECIEDYSASQLLFELAENVSMRNGRYRIIGPVDSSIWIKYRMKVNYFDKFYTGEPYNKPYYVDLWEKSSYNTFVSYYSNAFNIFSKESKDEKYHDRLQRKLSRGYEIRDICKSDIRKMIDDIYDMMIDLYSNFPCYKRITKEEFVQGYSYLGSVIAPKMSKIVYYNDKPVAFFISIPDYKSNLYGTITPIKLLKILMTKRNPKRYIMLYMGVDSKFIGTGKLLSDTIREQLKIEAKESVGALIREDKVDKGYFKDNIDFRYKYLLFEKNLQDTTK